MCTYSQMILVFKQLAYELQDFYWVMVDKGVAQVNYRTWKLRANNLIVLASINLLVIRNLS